jgi:hypothetical protein
MPNTFGRLPQEPSALSGSDSSASQPLLSRFGRSSAFERLSEVPQDIFQVNQSTQLSPQPDPHIQTSSLFHIPHNPTLTMTHTPSNTSQTLTGTIQFHPHQPSGSDTHRLMNFHQGIANEQGSDQDSEILNPKIHPSLLIRSFPHASLI